MLKAKVYEILDHSSLRGTFQSLQDVLIQNVVDYSTNVLLFDEKLGEIAKTLEKAGEIIVDRSDILNELKPFVIYTLSLDITI